MTLVLPDQPSEVGGGMEALRKADPDRIGEYELLGYLGRGGQGVVYRAQHPDGGLVAIKRLHPGMADDDKIRARFIREAEAARRVAGFCTAQIVTTGVDDGTPYIVSEYIRGESLQQRVERDGPRNAAQMERLMVGTLTALSAIHQAGVVHRDFKPNNVLLSDDGPRVVDFGIARMLDDGPTLSGVVGTPAYMAPEQFGGHITPKADMFAWAATMYFAATGAPAFGSGTPPVIMFRVLNEEPDLTRLPATMRPILTQCLLKDPALRPDATALLLAMLGERNDVGVLGPQAALEQGQALAEANTDDLAPSPAGSPRPRRWFLLALGGGALALGGAALLNGEKPVDQKPKPAPPSPRAAPLEPGTSRILQGHNDMVNGVCFGVVGASPVLISVSNDETVRVWDPSTGKQQGPSLTGHQGWISSIAFTEFDNMQIAVSTAEDRKVKLWDLSTMKEHATLSGHDGWIRSLCVGRLKGAPIAVTASGDRTARVWDLRAGIQIGKPIKGFTEVVAAVALGERDYRPVVLIGDAHGKLTMCDLSTHERVGQQIQAHRAQINTITYGEYDGLGSVFTAGDDMVIRGWDVDSGEQKWSFRGHTQIIYALQFGILDDRNVLISAADDGSIRIWDLATREPYGPPLLGHRKGVRALTLGLIDGVTCIVSTGQDQSIRVWRS